MATTQPTIDLAARQLQVELGPLEDYVPADVAGGVTTTGVYVGGQFGNDIVDLYNDTAPTIRDYIYWDYFHRKNTPEYDISRLCYDIARGAISMPAGRIKLLWSHSGAYFDLRKLRDRILKAFEDIEGNLAADKTAESIPSCPSCGSHYSGGADEPYAWNAASCEMVSAPDDAELDSGPWNCWPIPTEELCGAEPEDIRPWSRPAYWPFIPVGNESPCYHLPQRRLTEDCYFNDLGDYFARSEVSPSEWVDQMVTRRDGFRYLRAGTSYKEVCQELDETNLPDEEKYEISTRLPGINPA